MYFPILKYLALWDINIQTHNDSESCFFFFNYNYRVCKPPSRSRTGRKEREKVGKRFTKMEKRTFSVPSSPLTITSHDSIRPISDQTNLLDATVCCTIESGRNFSSLGISNFIFLFLK